MIIIEEEVVKLNTPISLYVTIGGILSLGTENIVQFVYFVSQEVFFFELQQEVFSVLLSLASEA